MTILVLCLPLKISPHDSEELNVFNSDIMLDSIQTTSSEVLDLLCTLDVICAHLLKEEATELSSSLADLFNKSLRDSILSLDWVSPFFC